MILKEGQKAPEFTAVNQNGEKVSLKDFNKKKLILYFYPKDDTPGCTKESCNLRDNYEKLLKSGYEVIGVSMDDVNSHQKFADKYSLPFNLLADTDKKIVSDYGVYVEKVSFGKKKMGINRTTFIINEKGDIERIIKKVDTIQHAEQILSN